MARKTWDGEPPAIGCDLGGTNLKVVALRRGKVLDERLLPAPRDSAASVAAAIVRLVMETREQHLDLNGVGSPLLPGPVLGVAIPGFLDARRRRVVHLSNLPVLDGFPLAGRLERRLGAAISGRVVLDADSNAGALAEALLGAGRDARRVLYVTLGTGLGAAMVIEDEVVRVSNHTVGQVAHLPLDPRGPACPCGARGCAEAVLAARGICRRAARHKIPRADRRDPEAVFRAAADGSAPARKVFEETGDLLGKLLAMLTNFLSPDRVVLGGGIASASRFLLPAAEHSFRALLNIRLRGAVQIVAGRLGMFAGAIGAALQAVHSYETPSRE